MSAIDWRQAPATTAITAVTVLVSVAVFVTGTLPAATIGAGAIPARLSGLALPGGIAFVVPAWLTPLSSALLHGNLAHLGLNLVMLVYCGAQAERALGAKGVAVLYIVGAYAAAAGQWLPSPMSVTPMIGASGAISAVVAAYALLFGQRLPSAIGPLSARAVHILWLAAAWIGIQLLIGVSGMGVPGAGGAGVAIGAHIGGFLAGLMLARPLLLWRYRGA